MIERDSRWQSKAPMRAVGDRGPAKIVEGIVTRIYDDGRVALRVTRGHGSRSRGGRIYVRTREDLLTNWCCIDGYRQTEDGPL